MLSINTNQAVSYSTIAMIRKLRILSWIYQVGVSKQSSLCSSISHVTAASWLCGGFLPDSLFYQTFFISFCYLHHFSQDLVNRGQNWLCHSTSVSARHALCFLPPSSQTLSWCLYLSHGNKTTRNQTILATTGILFLISLVGQFIHCMVYRHKVLLFWFNNLRNLFGIAFIAVTTDGIIVFQTNA